MMYVRTQNILTVSFSFMSLLFCIIWLVNVVEWSHYQERHQLTDIAAAYLIFCKVLCDRELFIRW